MSPKVTDLGRLRSAGGRVRRARRPPRPAHGPWRRQSLAGAWLYGHVRAPARGSSARPLRPAGARASSRSPSTTAPTRGTRSPSPSCWPSAATTPRSSCSGGPSASTPTPQRRSARPATSSRRTATTTACSPWPRPPEVRAQLSAAEEAVCGATGEPPAPLFRPPHGVRSPWLAARRTARPAPASARGTALIFDTVLHGVETIVGARHATASPGRGDPAARRGRLGRRAPRASRRSQALPAILDELELRGLRSVALERVARRIAFRRASGARRLHSVRWSRHAQTRSTAPR